VIVTVKVSVYVPAVTTAGNAGGVIVKLEAASLQVGSERDLAFWALAHIIAKRDFCMLYHMR